MGKSNERRLADPGKPFGEAITFLLGIPRCLVEHKPLGQAAHLVVIQIKHLLDEGLRSLAVEVRRALSAAWRPREFITLQDKALAAMSESLRHACSR